ncbi:hypothetical protein EBQ25_10700 [Allofranklinella schreckenbergeri]|uniref:Uncharacterized protein n=1 Tax=Allofranklinella schreckenbergeri TaxID=1076744 RepID=A0A3M6Q2N1_9BURK|nr:hypothetical protein EBQ25_10700 [Allofranklinella schreckenbergeri]
MGYGLCAMGCVLWAVGCGLWRVGGGLYGLPARARAFAQRRKCRAAWAGAVFSIKRKTNIKNMLPKYVCFVSF